MNPIKLFDALVDWILGKFFSVLDWYRLYKAEKDGLVAYTKVKIHASLVYKGYIASVGKVHYIATITHNGVRYTKCVEVRRKHISRVKEAVLIKYAKKVFAEGINKKLSK